MKAAYVGEQRVRMSQLSHDQFVISDIEAGFLGNANVSVKHFGSAAVV